jgi:cytosine deaminase
MANLYANIAQIGDYSGLSECFKLITSRPATMMRLNTYGIEIGNPADIVALNVPDEISAVAQIAQPIFGYKNGYRTFSRPIPKIHQPPLKK